MMLTIMTDYGEYQCPESVRAKLWDALRVNGEFDRRYRIAPVAERYRRMVTAHMKRRWEMADA